MNKIPECRGIEANNYWTTYLEINVQRSRQLFSVQFMNNSTNLLMKISFFIKQTHLRGNTLSKSLSVTVLLWAATATQIFEYFQYC